jgi:hypothetical protein
MEPASVWQAQTDSYLAGFGERVCGNDYTSATSSKAVRNLFAPPNSTAGGDPRPVFIAINCVSNSPSHAPYQLLLKEFYDGGGAFDFSARVAAWRNILDSVQAPPPRLTNVIRSGTNFQFTFPGQRGRTNRVEYTTNFTQWTVATNVFGTNAPIVFRDPTIPGKPRRFYRVVRP